MASPGYSHHFRRKRVYLEALLTPLVSNQCFAFSTVWLYCTALHFQMRDFIARVIGLPSFIFSHTSTSSTTLVFGGLRALPMASPGYSRHFQPKKVCLEALLTPLESNQCFASQLRDTFSNTWPYCIFSNSWPSWPPLHFTHFSPLKGLTSTV
jgi:predicted ATPase with chaperone activity